MYESLKDTNFEIKIRYLYTRSEFEIQYVINVTNHAY